MMKQESLLPYLNKERLVDIETNATVRFATLKPKHDPSRTKEVIKKLDEYVNKVNYDFSHWLDVSLSAIEGRDKEYMALIKDMDKEKLMDYCKAFGVLSGFFLDGYYDDVLGQYYADRYRATSNGFYPTPFNVSLMMAKMLGVNKEDTVCDPCVGSGSLLLATKYVIHEEHGWMESCHFIPKMYGVDIGSVQVKMCKLQMYMTNYLYMIGRTIQAVEEIKQTGGIKNET